MQSGRRKGSQKDQSEVGDEDEERGGDEEEEERV